MDRHEVTVQRYNACVAARKCRPARTIYHDYSRPQQPKVGISWYHAVAYCKAMGQRLPTEVQWAPSTSKARVPKVWRSQS